VGVCTEVLVVTKKCKMCGTTKSIENFYTTRISSKGKQYYMSSCKNCESERAKTRNKIYGRAEHLKRRYGITDADIIYILRDQSWSCAICGLHFFMFNLKVCVDHDHNTGKVRGILCSHCNYGLGHFRDNPQYLSNATEYIKFWNESC